MKRKETKFYLGTILVLVSYYSIFNLVAKLDSVNQLSDFGFYGIQILFIVIEGIAATALLVKSQCWKEYGRFQFRWSYLGIFFLFFLLVFRGLLMTALSQLKKYYIDVIVSSTLFGLIHVLQYGWVLTDFIIYAGAGLLLCMFFRYTRSVYWSIALHIL